MKTIGLIFLLIFICGCAAAAAEDGAAAAEDGSATDQKKSVDWYNDFLENYNCLTYRFRPEKTCDSVGGECITNCPSIIRHYDTTTCECGKTCCVWL